MYEPGLDIVVVNYRTPNYLKKFLESYWADDTEVETDLFVIDVDPTEDDEYDMRDFLYANRQLDPSSYWPIYHNCGYAGACNFGALLGNKEAVAFFNADTKLYESVLDGCYMRLFQKSSYGIVGPLQVNSRGQVTHAGIFGTNKQPNLRGFMARKISAKHREVRDDAISVSGSAYFVKRECWDDVHIQMKKVFPDVEGAMMPSELYWEETAVSYIARSLGWKVVYDGTRVMQHEFDQAPKPDNKELKALKSRSFKMFRQTMEELGIEHN